SRDKLGTARVRLSETTRPADVSGKLSAAAASCSYPGTENSVLPLCRCEQHDSLAPRQASVAPFGSTRGRSRPGASSDPSHTPRQDVPQADWAAPGGTVPALRFESADS